MEIVPGADVDATEAVPDVHLSRLAAGEETSVQGFRIDPGAEVPEHSHPHEQAGVIVRGTLTFRVDGEELRVGPGDTYVISGDEPHGVINESEEAVVGYDVFSPPRTDPDWAE